MVAKQKSETGGDAKKFSFTKGRLDKIQPPRPPDKPAKTGGTTTAHDVYHDAGCTGLALRVSSNGVKSFFAFRWNTKKRQTERVSLGKYSADAFMSAEFERNPSAFVGQNLPLSIEMARRLAPEAIGQQKGQDLTLGELFDEYMERHVDKSKKTGEQIRGNFELLLGAWKKRKLSAITHEDCEQLHGRLGKERGIYTANRCIQLIRAVFNKGKSWKLFQGENPAEGITLFKETPRERFLSEDEIRRLFAVLETAPRDIKDLVHLSLYTGVRKMNACGMRWQDLKLKERIWTIPDTKSGGSQAVSLTDQEVKILEARRKHLAQKGQLGNFVFPSNSKSGHLGDPKRSWTTIRRQAGIEDLHFHDLRRSLGAWMASGNANLALIKGALGHKDMKTTMNVYARTKKDAERDAREAAHKKMQEAADAQVDENVVRLKVNEK